MFLRRVVSRPVALVRHRAAQSIPPLLFGPNNLGRRNVSQLSQSSSRISTVFGVLLTVGIVTTGYGLCVHLPFTPRVQCTHTIPRLYFIKIPVLFHVHHVAQRDQE